MRPAQFHYFTPSPALAGLVAFFYVLDCGPAAFDGGLCALLGQVQMTHGGTAHYRFGQREQAGAALSIIGPTDIAAQLTAPADTVVVGAGLTPAGWNALMPVRAGQLANRLVDARTLFADDAARMHAACADADPAVRAATIEAWLRSRIGVLDPRIAAIDAWVIAGDDWDVDRLAASLGLSRRQLERLTAATHGSTPKRLAAKYRALQAAARLAVGDLTDWRDAAAAGGYADQSHFIREFKRFVGVTPRRFLASPDSFVHRLIRGQWHPGRELGIAIWA